jgi:hypothetical protein
MKVMSVCILVISLVIQSWVLISLWSVLGFNPPMSCERSIRWDEWISCMHGMSHLHVGASEIVVGSWLVAGAAAFAARNLPPYISLVVPGSMAAIWLWWVIDHWNAGVAPHAPVFFVFAVATGLLSVYLVGPAAGAWLLGFAARAQRRSSIAAGAE